jgi:hypothetical protein
MPAPAAAPMTTSVGKSVALTLATPDLAQAQQVIDEEKQEDFDEAHSVLQKTGLVTLALTAFFGASTLALFVAQESVAVQSPVSPYDEGSQGKQDAMTGLRVANYALFSAQPVLGLLAANPGILGVPEKDREDVSAALRTVHFAVGGTLATTYTVNAALQW